MSRKIPKPDTLQINKYQDALTFLADPDRQIQGNVKSNTLINYAKNGIVLEHNTLENANLQNMVIRDRIYMGSQGKAGYSYESDFSIDENEWSAIGGSIAGNVDGIDGEDNVLKFWANGDNSEHRVQYANAFPVAGGQKYRITGKVYIPSDNTNIKAIQIGNGNYKDGKIEINTLGQWVDFELTLTRVYANHILRFYGGTGTTFTFTGANSENDDRFYIKDIKIKWIGLVGHWVLGEGYSGGDKLIYHALMSNTEVFVGYHANKLYYKDDVLGVKHVMKVYATGAPNPWEYHGLYASTNSIILFKKSKYKLRGKIYIPSTNTHAKAVHFVILKDPGNESPDYVVDTLDQWVSFGFILENNLDSDRSFRMTMADSNGAYDWTANDNENDDYFYVADLEIINIGGGGYIGEDWSKGGAFYELIDHDDFEDGLEVDEWWANNRSTKSLATDKSFTGNNSLKIECTEEGYFYAAKEWDVTPGETIMLNWWQTGSASHVFVKDTNGVYNGISNYFTRVESKGEWHHFQGFYIVPSNIAKIRIESGSSGNVGDVTYLDSVWVQRVSNSQLAHLSDGFHVGDTEHIKHATFAAARTPKLDAVNDWFYVEPYDEIDTHNEMTYAAVVQIDENQINDYPMILCASKTHVNYGIRYAAASRLLYFEYGQDPWDGSNYESINTGTGSVSKGKPHLVVATYDGTTIKIYLDGEYKNSRTPSTPLATGTFQLIVGRYLVGYVHEGAIWNYALSEKEIGEMWGNVSWEHRNQSDSLSMVLEEFSESDQRRVGLKILDSNAPSSTAWQTKRHSYSINESFWIDFVYRSNDTYHFSNGYGSSILLDAVDTPKRIRTIFSNNNSSNDHFLFRPYSIAAGSFIALNNTAIFTIRNNVNHGVMYNMPNTSWNVHPAAIQLDGVNDHIDYGPINAVGTNPFMFFGWFKTSANDGGLIARRYDTDTWYRAAIDWNGSGKLVIELSYDYTNKDTTGHYKNLFSDNAINDDIWHSYAFFRDKNSNVYLFIDKVQQQDSENFPETLDSPNTDDVQFKIGAWGANNHAPFAGLIGIHVGLVFNTDTLKELATFENLSELVNNFHDQTQHKYLGG